MYRHEEGYDVLYQRDTYIMDTRKCSLYTSGFNITDTRNTQTSSPVHTYELTVYVIDTRTCLFCLHSRSVSI